MKAYQIQSPDGLDALKLIDLPDPKPGLGEVLVRIKACSLNYRDLGMPHGGYARNDKMPLVPLSDGAGEVVEVGEGVTEFQNGDAVAGCFFRDWERGPVSEAYLSSGLGGGIDGALAEYVVYSERGLVKAPAGYSHQQAACLPCAAVTAWNALTSANLIAGQTVLALGTGGVSIFALQLAKAAGARVVITSSSDEKLARTRELGADETINYTETPDWHKAVRKLSRGGVDNVIEVGGVGTLKKSLSAVKVGGTVSLIGILTGRADPPSPLPILFNAITLRGIFVGSKETFQSMNRSIEANGIEPVIDRVFGFNEARAAYEHMQSAKHLGKIVISLE
jgi:NADPH:quinone reductase-like Zn-dependent oxidoreductase